MRLGLIPCARQWETMRAVYSLKNDVSQQIRGKRGLKHLIRVYTTKNIFEGNKRRGRLLNLILKENLTNAQFRS